MSDQSGAVSQQQPERTASDFEELRWGGNQTMRSFEAILIEQCAPVLAGIKMAGLFRYALKPEEKIGWLLGHWNRVFAEKGLRLTSLKQCQKQKIYLIYVYRPKQLEARLAQSEIQSFLSESGYEPSENYISYLKRLTYRMCLYSDFPHEIGIFLGYPLGDVKGFIQLGGEACLCCGTWKVYENVEEAQKRFAQYKKCTDLYQKLYADGRPLLRMTVAA